MVGVALFMNTSCGAVFPRTSLAEKSLHTQEQRTRAREEIRAVLREMERAEGAADLVGLEAIYTEQAVWQPPSEPAVQGRASILQRYAEMFASSRLSLEISDQSVEVSGQLSGTGSSQGLLPPLRGQVLGLAKMTFHPSESHAEESSSTQSFRMGLDRDVEGIWRVSFLTWRPWEELSEDEDGA